MKKTIYSLLIVLGFAAASCDEWEPVFGNQGDPDEEELVTLTPNTTIAELKAMYNGSPVHIESDIIIGGQVISSDASGNIYRSMYIQDSTGGIEVKIGLTSLYDDYKLGQWVYVKCEGLAIGKYNGMIQLGVEDPSGSYETAYMDVKSLIAAHVFKGVQDTPVSPVEIDEAGLKNSANYGKYVKISGLTYGNEIFCLWYPNPNGDTKSQSNRVFLSDETWGVTTWAMSKNKFSEYLESGVWDTATLGDGSETVAQLRSEDAITASAYAVSQYFKMGSTDVQVRTSGYSRFSDTEIDSEILDGAAVDLTGILTIYNSNIQFVLIDLSGVEIE
jgi:hypothetical protein